MSGPGPENVTRILSAIGDGDEHAAERLLPLVYDELRRLARYRVAGEPAGRGFRRRRWSMRPICAWLEMPAPNGRIAAISLPPRPRRCGEFWSSALARSGGSNMRRASAGGVG